MPRRAVATIGLAAVLIASAFVTGGGLDSNVAAAGNTWTELGLLSDTGTVLILWGRCGRSYLSSYKYT